MYFNIMWKILRRNEMLLRFQTLIYNEEKAAKQVNVLRERE